MNASLIFKRLIRMFFLVREIQTVSVVAKPKTTSKFFRMSRARMVDFIRRAGKPKQVRD